MKIKRLLIPTILIMSLVFVLIGCQDQSTDQGAQEETNQIEESTEQADTNKEQADGASTEEDTNQEGSSGTVVIKDINGEVEVKTNPQKIIALDNRTFDSLAQWDIDLAAVPKDVMPSDNPYVQDDSVENIGNHREPNLELIAAIDPDLVIIGQRFASFEEDIRALAPNADIINLNFDLSEGASSPGENFVNGFIDSTQALGKIFEREDEAETLIADFEAAIEGVKETYNPDETIMSVVVSGGDIGYSAPGFGRVWGPLYEIFDFTPALEVDGTSSDHKGDDISVEAIAQSNPDWILVLDRDAGVSSEESVPAREVLEESQALQNTKASQEGNFIFAPNQTYTSESIQTYIELFENMKENFSK